MEKTRDQIEKKYKWKIENIYESDELWEKDYNILKSKIGSLKNYEDTFLESADNLYRFIIENETLERKLTTIGMYAYLRSDEDKGNNKYLDFVGKVELLYQIYNESTAFFTPKLLEIDESQIQKFYKEKPELLTWKRLFEEQFRYKGHVLSEKENELLASFSNVLNSSSNTAILLQSTDMQYPIMKDESGNEVTITESNYSNLIRSNDRTIRKNSFEKLYEAYGNLKNTFASTLSSTVEYSTTSSRVHNFNTSLEESLYADEVEKSVYLNLITTVKKNLPILFDYYQMKKKVLGLDELHLYDIYVPIVKESKGEYLYSDACNIVKEALKILGSDYSNNLNKAFTEGWIDVYPNRGKKSGAYSWGCYDTKPYVLLNYSNKLDDVSTLAHELGHSMHSYYTINNNPYVTGDYRIFVAEVASTVNEMLLNHYLLNTMEDKNERLVILNNMLELFKGTIFRQTMFAEFEMRIHDLKEKGETLTSELLSKVYYDLNKEYFGPDVIVDEEIMYEWIRILHFYTPFYVYKYATGLSAACKIATDILAGKENAQENYISFLKSGSSASPIELLKIAGVDMNDPRTIESAIFMFKEILEQFKKELNI